MKKNFIIFVALLNFISFGTASSAYALIDPASLTLIFGAVFVTAVTGAETIKHSQEESAQVQEDQKDPQEKVQIHENADKVTETLIAPAPSGS